MRVAITGASGLLGGSLASSLETDGHDVVPLVRREASAGEIRWDPDAGRLEPRDLRGFDAVVHYASEPMDRRWGKAVRERILRSRVDGTRLLAEALASLDDPPPALLSASAVGFYGSRGDEILDESSSPGDDFLARVCREWEQAADPAREAGLRVVHLRSGVVIAADGPLIKKVRLPFSLGLGGRIGDGRQYVPWIALDDHVAATRFVLMNGAVAGPVNLTAPKPVTNAELTKAIGDVLNRPAVLPIPPVALKLLYGEMGLVLATASQRAVPSRLLDAGFTFTRTDVHSALRVALRP